MTIETHSPSSPFYADLVGKVDEHILHLQDARGVFLLDKLDERPFKYFLNQCLYTPWQNHFLFVMLVGGDRNLDVLTVKNSLETINPRLRDIFHAYNLQTFSDFDVEAHMYEYLKGVIFPEHSDSQRAEFFRRYRTLAYWTKKWLASKLSQEQQNHFQQFLFPMPSFDNRDFSFTKLAKEQAHNTRKSETDAIVPLLPQIRAEAHFRWNQMKRLRKAFLEACKQAEKGNATLPLEFHYDEPARIGERFYFRLWDKPSFVLYHQEQFSDSVIKSAKKRTRTYSEANNHYFVEFVEAEQLENDDMAEGLWFTEIIENGVLGQWYLNETDQELERKRQLLFSWGYGEESLTGNPEPFFSKHKGVLSLSTFVSRYSDKAEGVLFDVEPFYVAATFGLLAVDILTTTGARLNELLQISNSKDCIRVIKANNKVHFSFQAVPKGRDTTEPFYISRQTMKLIQVVSLMLKEHYNDVILSVQYREDRKHLFPDLKPYFFQYNHQAFKRDALYSCLRFLLHGLQFETQEGEPIVIKTHLLRHAFATEAVQRQNIPVDIVAKILHQRDVEVTGYYSEPTSSQVAESVDKLHSITANYVDLDETILRSPEELQKQYEKHTDEVGVFNNVLGGICVTNAVCPTKMQCLGCVAKIPLPEKKHELLEVIALSKDMEERFASMGLNIEEKKAKMMRKLARNELKEIELIEQYREEQNYAPHIYFKK